MEHISAIIIGNDMHAYPYGLIRFERASKNLFRIFCNLLQLLIILAVYFGYTSTNKYCNETTQTNQETDRNRAIAP